LLACDGLMARLYMYATLAALLCVLTSIHRGITAPGNGYKNSLCAGGGMHPPYPPLYPPLHRARETIELLTMETTEFIPPALWPPNSTDLNPVDYKVWSVTGLELSGGWTPQFMSTDAHFWVKIGFKFQSLGKISNISAADPPVLIGQFQHWSLMQAKVYTRSGSRTLTNCIVHVSWQLGTNGSVHYWCSNQTVAHRSSYMH